MPDGIETETAHSARIYDYILDSKDYYPATRKPATPWSVNGPRCPFTCARPHGRPRRPGLFEPLPVGSWLTMSIGTAEFAPDEVGRVAWKYAAQDMPMRLRTRQKAGEFFSGLDLVEPGVVQVHKWRPDGMGTEVIRDEDIAMYGAVARKPS